MVNTVSIEENTIWKILATICDPEIPVLTILDLGIVRSVDIADDAIEITITPTYTACPAMDMISRDILIALKENGCNNVKVNTVLSPVWTTEWISEEGKRKLNDYGIAPPLGMSKTGIIHCPHCNSENIKLLSEFGSTACKAMYQCNDCKEPFDYFKCH